MKSILRGVRSDQPLDVGRALTKLFLVIVVILAFLPQHTAEGGWNLRILAILLSPANEIGDTLAGIAGVLAFLWIIITVWLQSQELSAQREELRLTRLEMKEQREATQDMARAMSAQAKVFEDEQLARDESRTKDLLWEQLRGLSDSIDNCAMLFAGWEVDLSDAGNGLYGGTLDIFVQNPFPRVGDSSNDAHIKAANRKFEGTVSDLTKYNARIVSRPKKITEICKLKSKLEETLETASKASRDQIEFIKNLKIRESLAHLESLLENDELWDKTP